MEWTVNVDGLCALDDGLKIHLEVRWTRKIAVNCAVKRYSKRSDHCDVHQDWWSRRKTLHDEWRPKWANWAVD